MFPVGLERPLAWRWAATMGCIWMVAATWSPAPAEEEPAARSERRPSYRTPIYTDPDYVPWWISRDQYPSIDLGEAEGHGAEIAGQRVWGRALPFFAQDVIDLGFDLPNPYGLSAVYVMVRQDLAIDNLRVALGVDAPPVGPVAPMPAVAFSNAWSRNETVQFKADAWILPFLNVFLVGGHVNGKSRLDVNLDMDALFPGAGGGLGTVTGTAKLKFNGTNVGIGTNLAAGWENYFAVLSLTYAYSDLDIVDSRIEALNASPRIGFTYNLERWGALAVYTGATYLHADVEIRGRAIIPLPPVMWIPVGRTLVADYAVDQQNKDRWNYLVGGNWDINTWLSLQGEVGFGGSRDNVIASITYRF